MKKMPFLGVLYFCTKISTVPFIMSGFFCASPHKGEARITVVFDGETLLRSKRAEYINKYIYI